MNLAAEDFLSLSQDILGQGHRLRFQATGHSMSPVILHGAILEVEPRPGTEIRVGEVAFYRNPGGGLVAHRVVRKRFRRGRTIFLIKGDARSCQLEEVYSTQILGRVVRVEQHGCCRQLDRLPGRLMGKTLAYLSFGPPWLGRISYLLGNGWRLRLKARLGAWG